MTNKQDGNLIAVSDLVVDNLDSYYFTTYDIELTYWVVTPWCARGS
jgi:hypothetical protein